MSKITLTRWSVRAAIALALGLVVISIALFVSSEAFGADITWGGEYRVEAVRIADPELSAANSTTAYMLHHLILAPKIIAADGVTIYSRLDVLNNSTTGIDANGTVYSVAGDLIGNGPGKGFSSTSGLPNGSTTSDTNSFAQTERAGGIAVTELYATWTQEFGQLIVGRAPMQFGLGISYSAGNGLFDHYIDTKDMVAYKMVIGNLFIMPGIGKINEPYVGQNDDVTDYFVQVEYDNPETDLQLGVLYQTRVYTFGANDAPGSGVVFGDTTATRGNGGKSNLIAIFTREKVNNFTVGFEADLVSGDTGLQMSSGSGISMNAFGLAAEVGYKPQDSKYSGLFKLGMATGDDPGTTDVYEGFQFNRNYDVALLLFNHPLGQRDFLRTALVRNTTLNSDGTSNVRNQLDNEAISNAIYFAPSVQYQSSEHLSYGATLVHALLNRDPLGAGSGTGTDLGWEVDGSITYKPQDRFTWISEIGFLLPGSAWAGGSNGFETKLAYGLSTKAAITF